MASKTIAWNTGGGNITLSYGGQGNGSVSVSSSENSSFDARSQSIYISTTLGSPEKNVAVTITQQGKSYSPGDVFNFDYTGSVQSIVLPKGKYKLQCWGAQGGTSYGSSSGAGSKGGYSEGVLTLDKTTTLYVFVGGKGSRGSSSSLVNGGWNGGGASVGYSSYNSGGTNGYSYPACGGGATDISTVTSSMSYSSGRTNRSSASLLARCIVAGGGAGGSYRYTSVETTSSYDETIISSSSYSKTSYGSGCYIYYRVNVAAYVGETVTFEIYAGSNTSAVQITEQTSSYGYVEDKSASGSSLTWTTIIGSSTQYVEFKAYNYDSGSIYPSSLSSYGYITRTTTDTSTSSSYSNKSQQGGGTSGCGQYPGTQTLGGQSQGDGGFGYGANQGTTSWRYVSGAGGGGWYGGGTSWSDSSTAYINYSGGGSGFVNTAANASSRPSGYTGLQLDSGTTTAGNTSHPSTSGGTETGHAGNGYAKITVIE